MDTETLLAQLMDGLPEPVFFKDADGRYLRINRALALWYALKDPADAIGKSDADFYPKAFAKATADIEAAIVKSGVPILGQEERVVGPDGKTRWVSTTKMPLRDASGGVVGTYGFSRDIRSLKQAQEKTRDSEALYQSLIETLPQCIFRKDLEGRYLYVNQRLCDVFKLKPKDFIGRTDLDMNPRDLADKYRRDDQWVVTHQKLFEAVEELKSKRRRIKIHIFKTPVYDSNGRVVGVQGVFTPLTETKAR